MGNEKTAIFEHVLIQRINRKLSANTEQLRRSRSFQLETSVGHYFIVDLKRNSVERQQIDLEQLGRELGVLADGDVVIFGGRNSSRSDMAAGE
jgi:hypothetical protein